MYCHDLEVVSSNPDWVKFLVHNISVPSLIHCMVPSFFIAARNGGQMGLFLGASLISLSEILEWLLDALMHMISKIMRQNKVHTAQPDWCKCHGH